MRPWLVLVLSLIAAGCSDGNAPPADSDRLAGERDIALDGRRPSDGNAVDLPELEPRPPGEFGTGGCDQQGNHFQLRYIAQSFDIDSSDAKTVSGAQGIIGFTGSSPDGYRFWFGRQGDPDAGAFTEAKTYVATTPPFHMLLQRWPAASGATCAAAGSSCQTYYGLNGVFILSTVKAPTQGSFNIGQIVQQTSCWVEQPSGPPKLTCQALGGNVFGCFKVD